MQPFEIYISNNIHEWILIRRLNLVRNVVNIKLWTELFSWMFQTTEIYLNNDMFLNKHKIMMFRVFLLVTTEIKWKWTRIFVYSFMNLIAPN